MPSIIKGHVIQARDLPVMERNMQGDLYTDAYVDIRFGDSSSRTQVKHKTLAPEWNEPFRFDVFDNDDLQSEPLEFRVMDHDVYTSDDSVGIVHVDLSPLLMRISESDDLGTERKLVASDAIGKPAAIDSLMVIQNDVAGQSRNGSIGDQ